MLVAGREEYHTALHGACLIAVFIDTSILVEIINGIHVGLGDLAVGAAGVAPAVLG